MQLSKTWEKSKTAFLVAVVAASTLLLSFVILHFTHGKALSFFDGLLAAFLYIPVLISPLAAIFWNYVDGIIKEIASLPVSNDAVNEGIRRLSLLKREIILNVVLVFVVLAIERGLNGLSSYFSAATATQVDGIALWTIISFRLVCFSFAVLIIIDFIKGLVTAIEFRNVIKKL